MRMKLLRLSALLGLLVEPYLGYLSDAEKKVLVDNRKKDTHALNQINLAIDKVVYEKIRKAKASKQAWEILQKAYKGDEQVKNVQLPILRSEF